LYVSRHIALPAAKIAKEALKEKRSAKEIAMEKGVLKPKQAEKIFYGTFFWARKGETGPEASCMFFV
jgi:aspartate ammonia-lyase